MVKVCTVIVSYNAAQWIEKCLQHLLASTYPTTIIVVDNHSTDNTTDLLQPYKNRIELIKNDQNLGFGKGNNIGIEMSLKLNADLIFLLNQDVYVFEDCIGLLVTSMKKNPAYGIISPMQLDSSGKQQDAHFKKYLSRVVNTSQINKMLQTENAVVSTDPIPLPFVNAAAWIISNTAIKKVGFFHPVFVHYGEDHNYSSRMQFHKFKVGVLSSAKVIHDRKNEQSRDKKLLLRKLRTIPLYTLLDIRKPLLLAYLLGYSKLKRIKKKLAAHFTDEVKDTYLEQKKWFTHRLPQAINIRKETKKSNFN
jgi:GT2 family glycosyltransferase